MNRRPRNPSQKDITVSIPVTDFWLGAHRPGINRGARIVNVGVILGTLFLFCGCMSTHAQSGKKQEASSVSAIERAQKATEKSREFSAPDPIQVDNAKEFEGEWSYRNDCDRGHYVTLDIKRDNDLLTGSWSDGTLLRGSQGLLKGRLSRGRLIAEWCSEYEEAGAPAPCPNYDPSEDYLEARGGTIVWYQKYGQEYSEYVVLTKGSKPHRSTKACDDQTKGSEHIWLKQVCALTPLFIPPTSLPGWCSRPNLGSLEQRPGAVVPAT